MSKTDKNLSQRISHLRIVPSAAAWDRINAGMHKKKSIPRQWFIAAAIALLLGGGFIIENFLYQMGNPIQMQVTNEPDKMNSENLPSLVESSTNATTTPFQKRQNRNRVYNNNKSQNQNPIVVFQTEELPILPEEITMDTINILTPHVSSTPQPDIVTSTSEAMLEGGHHSTAIKLHYSQSELKARFLKTKDVTASTVPAKNNRLINLTSQWKNPATVYEDLRQIKDELFSFSHKEFKTDHAND